MTSNSGGILDVAIVGGGISGLYVGWRLLTGKAGGGHDLPGRKIVVYELSGRTGGRLLTWYPFPDDLELHAELGGMRFFQQQELVWNLITRHYVAEKKLKDPIRFFVADPNGNNLWYLRERILKARDLRDPRKPPYLLDAATRYADPSSIINNIISQVLAENRVAIAQHLGGRTTPENWEDWDRIKPCLHYRGRRLWEIGFWNLLSDFLSPESYAFVTEAFGYYSITNNWNAAEAMQSIYNDFTQNPDYQTLREGFGYLPELVRQDFLAAGGKVELDHQVASVNVNSDGLFELTVKFKGKEIRTLARQVVLAMPRRSLELLQETPFWQMDRPAVGGRTLGSYVQSVIPYPAFKLFVAYPTQWWQQPPISIAAGRSVSDLPIRQTYYFPSVPEGFPPDKPPLDGRGLVMASYDDANAVPFWRALEGPEDDKTRDKELLGVLRKGAVQMLSRMVNTSTVQGYAAASWSALENEPGFHLAPPEMVRHARQQLRLLHFNQPLPDPLTVPGRKDGEPYAAYKDWSHDPFGGGWNFWAPSVDVKQVMEGIRKPFAGSGLYIVGEAYSGSQGWVEGALTSAERALRDHFHLQPAPWQPGGYYLGY